MSCCMPASNLPSLAPIALHWPVAIHFPGMSKPLVESMQGHINLLIPPVHPLEPITCPQPHTGITTGRHAALAPVPGLLIAWERAGKNATVNRTLNKTRRDKKTTCEDARFSMQPILSHTRQHKTLKCIFKFLPATAGFVRKLRKFCDEFNPSTMLGTALSAREQHILSAPE